MANFSAFIVQFISFMLASTLSLSAWAESSMPNTRLTSAAPVPKLLVLGDSLSAEYGIRRNSGWVALLDARLKQQGFNYHIQNASISGETTSGGLTRLPALLQQHQPKILIIELGANDGLRGLPVDNTRKNLSAMISAGKKSKARILLIGMQLPPNYGTQYTQQFAALFRELAHQHKVALLPFLFEDIARDASFFQNDQIHPNEKAQPVLLESVWKVLQPLLKN